METLFLLDISILMTRCAIFNIFLCTSPIGKIIITVYELFPPFCKSFNGVVCLNSGVGYHFHRILSKRFISVDPIQSSMPLIMMQNMAMTLYLVWTLETVGIRLLQINMYETYSTITIVFIFLVVFLYMYKSMFASSTWFCGCSVLSLIMEAVTRSWKEARRNATL